MDTDQKIVICITALICVLLVLIVFQIRSACAALEITAPVSGGQLAVGNPITITPSIINGVVDYRYMVGTAVGTADVLSIITPALSVDFGGGVMQGAVYISVQGLDSAHNVVDISEGVTAMVVPSATDQTISFFIGGLSGLAFALAAGKVM